MELMLTLEMNYNPHLLCMRLSMVKQNIIHKINKLRRNDCLSIGHDSLVEVLINYGADVNAADFFGRTPLYLASRDGKLKHHT